MKYVKSNRLVKVINANKIKSSMTKNDWDFGDAIFLFKFPYLFVANTVNPVFGKR